MSEHEQHRRDEVDIVDRAAAALRDVAVPDGPSERLLADTLSALRAADEGRHLDTSNNSSRRRIFTMRFVAKLAVAAVLAIVVGALVWTAGPLGGHAAFADVVEKVQQVHSVRYKSVVTGVKGTETGKGVTMLIAGDRMRQEAGNGAYVFIMDSKTGQAISLMPTMKRAFRVSVENAPKVAGAAREQNILDRFRAIQGKDAKPIGRKEIDGRTLDGYVVELPGRTMTVWADPETRLPVRIDAKLDVPMVPKAAVVMKDFEWNVPVDESALSLAVPAGYTVQDVKVNGSKATEADLVEGLRRVATANNGAFPDVFDVQIMMLSMKRAIAVRPGGQAADMDKAFKEAMDKLMPVARGVQFVHDQNGADFHYAGKGAKLGEKGRPVFWYRPVGSEKYRVIDADLTVKDVAADELPKVASQQVKPSSGATGMFGSPTATRPATGQ